RVVPAKVDRERARLQVGDDVAATATDRLQDDAVGQLSEGRDRPDVRDVDVSAVTGRAVGGADVDRGGFQSVQIRLPAAGADALEDERGRVIASRNRIARHVQ